ncbi:MAG: PSD1 and planctomycete cytochrome C domain-containing protein, partial [Pirellulaceae bacterium]
MQSSNPMAADSPAADPEAVAHFERAIRPILAQHCYECHSAEADTVEGDLRVDRRDGLLRGGDRGPAIVPSDSAASLLMQAVRYEDPELEMPPSGRLPDETVRLLSRWIEDGAAMPTDRTTAEARKSAIDYEAGRQFWSFQPLRRIVGNGAVLPEATLPNPFDDFAIETPDSIIDRLLEERRREHNLRANSQADRRTQARRVYFDLIGLPPTMAEIEAFLQDRSPDAYERMVDRLLASPHYGERWARHWLDLARYTDTTASWLESTASAHLYRDWVVRALNDDMPYDEFVRRQLATDLMPHTGPEDYPALGFLGLSPTYWKELKLAPDVIATVVAEEWEERIDAVGRTFLGLTLACARCHDHKFDPVGMDDYYALAGVFASSRIGDRLMLPDEQAARVLAARAEVTRIEAELKKLRQEKSPSDEQTAKIAELDQRVAELRGTPNFDAPSANGVVEASLYVLPNGPNQTKLDYKPGEPRDVPIQRRGSTTNLGPIVPRRFLRVLSTEAEPPLFTHGSGRLELADAIVTDAAPLAARVIVNRVWMHHFGRGLVTTPSDFGSQGERPSHPELLDELAARFIEHRWSLKWLHRQIVQSAAYRQSSVSDRSKPDHESDPDNRWLCRMNRRRLEIEVWRDALLAVTDSLDRRIGGTPMSLADANNRRRTLYGLINRREVDTVLALNDFPSAERHSPRREPTTTPLQQLFVLNSP